jgi:hypothetical protein
LRNTPNRIVEPSPILLANLSEHSRKVVLEGRGFKPNFSVKREEGRGGEGEMGRKGELTGVGFPLAKPSKFRQCKGFGLLHLKISNSYGIRLLPKNLHPSEGGERERGRITQLAITNYQLPITNYQLPITNYQLPITNYQLPVTND